MLLTAAPVPSVAEANVCIMEISTCVVDEFGMAPNWFRSMISRTAGPT